MFTNVKPTVRHIAPDDLNGRSLVKVVYVVLEPQYQSALSSAIRAINTHNSEVAFEVSGYLIEELRSQENYEAFKKDISEANIFIASLIFIEDWPTRWWKRCSPIATTWMRQWSFRRCPR
jgi:magnesium chelatase subunit H